MGIIRPYYGVEDTIAEIAKIDEKINELFIKREVYVKDLKKQIKKTPNSEN